MQLLRVERSPSVCLFGQCIATVDLSGHPHVRLVARCVWLFRALSMRSSWANVPLTVSLNVVHCVAMFARVVTSSLTGELQNFMIFEVFTVILTIGVAVLFESLSRSQMRATLEASLATESQRNGDGAPVPRLRRSGDIG